LSTQSRNPEIFFQIYHLLNIISIYLYINLHLYKNLSKKLGWGGWVGITSLKLNCNNSGSIGG